MGCRTPRCRRTAPVRPLTGCGRCADRSARTIASKISAADQAAVKAACWGIFDLAGLGDVTPGRQLVELVRARIDAFAEAWGRSCPAAVRSLLTDRHNLTSYLRFPAEHHKRVRHCTFIERTFGETRRVKVIGRFAGETSCVSLVRAVLDRASRGWRGFTTTPAGLRVPQDLRRALLHPPTQLHPASQTVVTTATEAA
ncbi:transposase [Planomonospora sp. ID67723]|uniref:transposase n=1 Tax=Planomonospora sp. ID67723 TaxID=2738134 RepID=UPI0018C43DD9|nr:transposase [Planomonospora sp. ID67723]MBG0831538.1 transposase [Planomonospora sp. ID67723]